MRVCARLCVGVCVCIYTYIHTYMLRVPPASQSGLCRFAGVGLDRVHVAVCKLSCVDALFGSVSPSLCACLGVPAVCVSLPASRARMRMGAGACVGRMEELRVAWWQSCRFSKPSINPLVFCNPPYPTAFF